MTKARYTPRARGPRRRIPVSPCPDHSPVVNELWYNAGTLEAKVFFTSH